MYAEVCTGTQKYTEARKGTQWYANGHIYTEVHTGTQRDTGTKVHTGTQTDTYTQVRKSTHKYAKVYTGTRLFCYIKGV